MDETDYEPRLQFYHMCNLEIGSWNGVNKRRLEASIIIAAVEIKLSLLNKCLKKISILGFDYYHCIENSYINVHPKLVLQIY